MSAVSKKEKNGGKVGILITSAFRGNEAKLILLPRDERVQKLIFREGKKVRCVNKITFSS